MRKPAPRSRRVKRAPVAVPVGTPKPKGTMAMAVQRAGELVAQGAIDSAAIIRGLYPSARALGLPTLPPGVVPEKDPPGIKLAMDNGLVELARDQMPATTGLFDWANTGLSFGYFFQGYPYLSQLVQISEYRAPSEVQATEMTRKWMKLKTKDTGKKDEEQKDGVGEGTPLAGDASPPKPMQMPKVSPATEPDPDGGPQPDPLADKIAEIEQCLEDFDVRGKFRMATVHDGWFGQGWIYIRIKGQDTDERRQLPLLIDPESIPVGSLLGFQNIEPYWVTPYSYNATDPTRPDFYKPSSVFVSGKKTHTTRLMSFIARPVPDLYKPSYNFGGLSWTQLLEPTVNMWLRTRKSVNDLIHKFSVTALMTNLAAMIAEPEENGGVIGRAQLMANGRDNLGVLLMDKATEELAQVNTPLSSLDKLQAQSQEHMAAIVHQPLVVLTGVTPSGLNASSEGEIQVWHEFISAQQKNTYDHPLKMVIEAIQCHLYGKIDDAITHEWVPLDEPTAKELAEERKSDADADNVYVQMGAIGPDEVRDRLSKSPQSGYDGLSGEAPGPPAPMLDPNNMLEGDDDEPPAK